MESKQCLKIRNCTTKKFQTDWGIVYKLTNNKKFNVLPEEHRQKSVRNLVQKLNDYNTWIPDTYRLIAEFVSSCNICDSDRSEK